MWPTCSVMVSPVLLLLVSLSSVVQGDAGDDLRAIQETFFEWSEEQFPEFSTDIGITKEFNGRLADMSTDAFTSQLTAVQGFINRTKSIDRTLLTRQEGYSYDVFMDTLTTFSDNYMWRWFGALNPVNFLEAFYLDLNYIITVTPFNTKEDFENYISRLEGRPAQIDQIIDRMKESIRRGTTYHLQSVKTVPSQISAVIDIPPVQSPLYSPLNDTLDNLQLPQADKNDLRSRALKGLRGMWLSLGLLKTFIENDYSHHTRGTVGVGGLPSGGNYYRACLSWHLSLDMLPAQVHDTGLKEVDRISQLMHQVMRKHGFNGTISEYYDQLKADAHFHKSTGEEVIAAYQDIITNRIYPKLGLLFKDIPPNRVVVKALPYDGPAGMYQAGSEDGSRPGTFFANINRPSQMNTFDMVSLTLHETVPGHHLQSAYQMRARLPNFQKHIPYNGYFAIPYHFPFYTAYTEGWGLYSEYLGEEMGVYADDYELMGRYGYEIFRACRLVVDTGLHYFGWTREKAIQYISDHTPMPRADVEIEVDRYLTWPGQACAYKIGEMRIKELRHTAATALGAQFDVREFHSLLLDNGPVPLRMLDTIVNDYIADHRVDSTVETPGDDVIG